MSLSLTITSVALLKLLPLLSPWLVDGKDKVKCGGVLSHLDDGTGMSYRCIIRTAHEGSKVGGFGCLIHFVQISGSTKRIKV